MIQLIFKLAKFWLLLLLSLFFVSCVKYSTNGISIGKDTITGSGVIVTEQRDAIQEFDKIQVSSMFKVEIEQASVQEITVRADDNLMQHIKTEIVDSTLKIYFDNVSIRNPKELKVFVKMPKIEGLTASSSSEIKANNIIKTNRLNLKSSSTAEIELNEVNTQSFTAEASSSSDIKVNKLYAIDLDITTTSTAEFEAYAEADKVELKASSSSKIKLKGKALGMNVNASSTATIDTRELVANDIKATSSSSSTVKIHPVLTLKATASSASSIHYYNDPQLIDKTTSSAASIKKK